MDNQSLSHVRWKCQYHIVFIPKYRKKVLYGKLRNDVREVIHTWFYPCGEPGAVKGLIFEILEEDREAVFYYMREQDAVLLTREFPGRKGSS